MLNVHRSSAGVQHRGVAGGVVRGVIFRYKRELSSQPLRSYAVDVSCDCCAFCRT